jgi:hypothetical protein
MKKYIEEALKLSKEIRPHNEKELYVSLKEREKEIIERIISLLPIYKLPSEKENVDAFAEKINEVDLQLNKSENVYSKEQLNREAEYNINIKVMGCDSSGHNCLFVEYLSSYEMFREMEGGACPLLLDIGVIDNEKGKTFLIAEAMAMGVRGDIYIKRKFDEILQKKEKNNFNELLKYMNCYGTALGELHSGKSGCMAMFCQEIMDNEKNMMEIVFENVKNKAEQEKLEYNHKFEDFVNEKEWDALCSSLKNVLYSKSFLHFDPNTLNVFYDEENENFSFIDFTGAQRSISLEGEPLLAPERDLECALRFVYYSVVRCCEGNVELKAILEMSVEEIYGNLTEAFYSSYFDEGALEPNEILMRFYGYRHKKINEIKKSVKKIGGWKKNIIF